ncbi:MAG: hypothetical protein ACO3K7_02430 [Candidatus Marinamargulisbacteria bacterium]
MNRFRCLYGLTFSIAILLTTGCGQSTSPLPTTSIPDITIHTGNDEINRTYTILVNQQAIGTNNMTIRTVWKNSPGVTKIEETVIIQTQSQTLTTHIKKQPTGGYQHVDDNTTYLPLPLSHNRQLSGPFSAISTQNITLQVVAIHDTYINALGHEFTSVAEAHDAKGTIRLFLNAEHFIIQKEDHRYAPTIQSLQLTTTASPTPAQLAQRDHWYPAH